MHLTVCSYHVTYSHLNFRFYACFEQGVLWHSGNYRVWIHSETRTWHDKDIQSNAPLRTYSQMHRTDKYSHYSLIVCPVWLNGRVFVYELSGCGFESHCSHLNFRSRACFELGLPWHSGNYRVWIHSETCKWHDKNIQSYFLFYFIFELLSIFISHFHLVNIKGFRYGPTYCTTYWVVSRSWKLFINKTFYLERIGNSFFAKAFPSTFAVK